MKIWVNFPRKFPGAIFNFVASYRCRRVSSEIFIFSILARMAARAFGSVSTKRQKAAPREMASNPSAPEPAKISATIAPSSGGAHSACFRILKTDSRVWSEVGRVLRPLGVAMFLPRNLPETILTIYLGPFLFLGRAGKISLDIYRQVFQLNRP